MGRRIRRNRRNGAATKSHCGSNAVSGFNVPEQTRQYALKLIGNHELTEQFLGFILFQLSTNEREDIVNFFYQNMKTKPGSNNLDECRTSLHEPEEIAQFTMKDIYSHKISFRKRELNDKIVLMMNQKKQKGKDGFARELKDLQDIFHLDDGEIRVIIFLYCYEQDPSFETLCDSHQFSIYLQLMSDTTEVALSSIRKILSKKGKLEQCGFIYVRNTSNSPYFMLEGEITEYLSGFSDTPLTEKYCRKSTDKTYDINSFALPNKNKDIVRSLICGKAGFNILILGPKGTGKTEFVKAIVRDCGKDAYFVQYGDEGEVTDRRRAIIASIGTVSPEKGIIIVDEADMFLNTSYMFFSQKKTVDKGWLNNFLDNSQTKIIWITNNIHCIEGSVLRRFSYSCHFKKFTKRERENVWAEHLTKHPLKKFITAKTVKELSAKYDVNASGIGSALETAGNILQAGSASTKSVTRVLDNLLLRHHDLAGNGDRKTCIPLTEKYDISALNIDANFELILRSLKTFASSNIKEDPLAGSNINILFTGTPGTGKTELAKFISSETGMDLLTKRASDLLSCWVGETEKNIREAFDEAQRQRAILFLDEADSFFTNRENASKSWEVTQTNELLTQMENHNGILICCTNLLDNLDRAAIRRFDWKVKFKPLTREGKTRLYRKYFKLSKPFTKEQGIRIKNIPELTPGDFKTVLQKYRFISAGSVNHDEIILALETEVKYKKRGKGEKIGFN